MEMVEGKRQFFREGYRFFLAQETVIGVESWERG